MNVGRRLFQGTISKFPWLAKCVNSFLEKLMVLREFRGTEGEITTEKLNPSNETFFSPQFGKCVTFSLKHFTNMKKIMITSPVPVNIHFHFYKSILGVQNCQMVISQQADTVGSL